MYVTNNERGRDNEIFLSSSGGEIRTYLLPSTTENEPLYNPATPHPATPPFTPSLQQPELGRKKGVFMSVAPLSTPLEFGTNDLDSMQMLVRIKA